MSSASALPGSAIVWAIGGLVAVCFAGAVALFCLASYGVAFGRSQTWCTAPGADYRFAVVLGLAAISAHLPGLWLLNRRLPGQARLPARIVVRGPMIFATASVLGMGIAHASHCLAGPATGAPGLTMDLVNAGSYGVILAPVFLAVSALVTIAMGSRLDGAEGKNT